MAQPPDADRQAREYIDRVVESHRRNGAVAAAGTAAEYDWNADTTIPKKTSSSPASPVAAPKTAVTTSWSDGTAPNVAEQSEGG